ncbi:MAG: pseudouridine synthase [Crenarchaeota archaeon]|mgnify:CR=1 FL=1|nr:pseudouridine synthase [Thermoproteota archaeon]
MESDLRRIQSIADYQFGKGAGQVLFPKDVEIQYSNATGRIRYINLNNNRIATLRPTDGLLSLSIDAAKILKQHLPLSHCFITARSDIAKFVADGGDLFAAHVVKVDKDVCPKDEVIVLDEEDQVIAVGRAFLSSSEIEAFKTGIAVKVRHGSKAEN